jgi:hypothetical protein
VLLAALALSILPVSGQACEDLTQHFELCSEGTPWAAGRWENGGDSATLYLGTIGFEGYEQYIGSDKATSLRGALDLFLRETAENRTRQNHVRDKFSTADLKIVRSIDTEQYKADDPTLWVVMIAQAADKTRIELSLTAPQDTPVADLDRLSREYAARVRPRPEQAGN